MSAAAATLIGTTIHDERVEVITGRRYASVRQDGVVVSFCPAAYTRELRKAIPALRTPLEGSRGIGEQRGRLSRLEALR